MHSIERLEVSLVLLRRCSRRANLRLRFIFPTAQTATPTAISFVLSDQISSQGNVRFGPPLNPYLSVRESGCIVLPVDSTSTKRMQLALKVLSWRYNGTVPVTDAE